MSKLETRICNSLPVELRECDDGKKHIRGYAAVWYNANEPGTQYSFAENYAERIHPEAFNRYLDDKQNDVSALFDHDTARLLGRRSNGTLTLTVDQRGLAYEVELPNTPTGDEVAELVSRGDLQGSSFGFIRNEKADKVYRDGSTKVRELRDIELLRDVGPVTHPAYDATSVYSRSADEVQKEIDEQLEPEEPSEKHLERLALLQERELTLERPKSILAD